MEGKAWKARSEKKGGVKTKVSDNGKGCSRRDQTGHHRRPRRCRANRAWRPSLFCIHVPWLQRRRCQGPRAFLPAQFPARSYCQPPVAGGTENRDRKSTRLNSSHLVISYAVFCLKKT